jgi:glycosyltransferase involved in cell wall biosynthesis
MMITYNHEPYIREAIESVFAQDFNGPMELVIGEDCSTDNTRAIIEDVCRDAPIHVRLLTSERNVGMHANGRRVLAECRGKYIALLEGDDEWLLPSKTAIQVSILEGSPHLSMCFGRCEIRYVTMQSERFGPTGGRLPKCKAQEFNVFDFIQFSDLIPTASVMVRASMWPKIPRWAYRMPWVDWTLWALLSLKGPLAMVDECLSVYNVGEGASSKFDEIERMAALCELLLRTTLLQSRSKSAELLRILDPKLRHQVSFLERRDYRAKATFLLRLWVSARIRALQPPGDIERWYLRSLIGRMRDSITWKRQCDNQS